jgi:hypothetical protein
VILANTNRLSLISIERDRLLSLVEFVQQSARLRAKPAANVATHGLFALYEHQMQGLPGIRVNVNDADFLGFNIVI